MSKEFAGCSSTTQYSGETRQSSHLIPGQEASPGMSGDVAGMNKYVASIGHARYEVDPTVLRGTMPKALVFSRRYAGFIRLIVFPGRLQRVGAKAFCYEGAEAALGCL